jgi:hypothetical protein
VTVRLESSSERRASAEYDHVGGRDIPSFVRSKLSRRDAISLSPENRGLQVGSVGAIQPPFPNVTGNDGLGAHD